MLSMSLKNISVFYILICLPLALLVLAAKYHYVTSEVFTFILLGYALIYHPLISGLRLLACNKISKGKFWSTFIPFWNWKYFGFLFFNKQINYQG